MSRAPSGEQFEIRHGGQLATIVEVGGGLRTYSVTGRDVLEPYAVQDMCDGAHGAVLIPWPNRLGEGRYRFGEVDYQLALTEPARGNAIHGLLRWRSWRALEHQPDRVVMGARLHPEPGYPFDLDVSIEYRLTEDGLSVSMSAVNRGERACPFGAGAHPYLSAGGGLIDDCTLELPAGTLITIDPDRALPVGREQLGGGDLDFRVARPLGQRVIDSPMTDLQRGEDGLARARLSCPDAAVVELWVDQAYPVLELFTGDTLAPARRRRGLAVEPMTCPPNALQSGELLQRIEPGESAAARWGVRLLS